MAALTNQQKLFVVQRLACYFSPSEVEEMFKEEFEVEITRQQIALYNPECVAGQSLSASLRAEYQRARKAFLADRESIAIAQQNFRLRELLTLYRNAKGGVIKAKFLEQAAKETGGAYARNAPGEVDDGDSALSANLDLLDESELQSLAALLKKATPAQEADTDAA